MKSESSITIKDSVIIGNKTQETAGSEELKSDMEEAKEGLELLRQLKSINREDTAGYQQIKNEEKVTDAKIKIMKTKAENANERRKGELAAFELARSLNELRSKCINENAFAVKESLEILKTQIKDEKALEQLENINKLLDAVYDYPFRKLEETHQIRVLEMCNYIEDNYFTNLTHDEKEA